MPPQGIIDPKTPVNARVTSLSPHDDGPEPIPGSVSLGGGQQLTQQPGALHRSLGQQTPLVVRKKPLWISCPDPVQSRWRDKVGGPVHDYRLVA